MSAKPVKANGKLRIAVYEYLKTCLSMDGEFCVYTEGHSDRTVAEHFQTTVSIVATTRKMAFGNLRAARAPARGDLMLQLRNRVALLETEVSALEDRLTALERAVGFKP